MVFDHVRYPCEARLAVEVYVVVPTVRVDARQAHVNAASAVGSVVRIVVGDKATAHEAGAADFQAPGDVPGHHVADVLRGEPRHGQRVAGVPDGVEGGGVVALGTVLASEPDVVVETPGVAD